MSCKTRQKFEVSIGGGSEEDEKGQLLIQGNSTEMVSVLGGYSVGSCERESSYENVSNSE